MAKGSGIHGSRAIDRSSVAYNDRTGTCDTIFHTDNHIFITLDFFVIFTDTYNITSSQYSITVTVDLRQLLGRFIPILIKCTKDGVVTAGSI